MKLKMMMIGKIYGSKVQSTLLMSVSFYNTSYSILLLPAFIGEETEA